MREESGERIIPVSIEDEMKTAYIDYSMSRTIVLSKNCKSESTKNNKKQYV